MEKLEKAFAVSMINLREVFTITLRGKAKILRWRFPMIIHITPAGTIRETTGRATEFDRGAKSETLWKIKRVMGRMDSHIHREVRKISEIFPLNFGRDTSVKVAIKLIIKLQLKGLKGERRDIRTHSHRSTRKEFNFIAPKFSDSNVIEPRRKPLIIG